MFFKKAFLVHLMFIEILLGYKLCNTSEGSKEYQSAQEALLQAAWIMGKPCPTLRCPLCNHEAARPTDSKAKYAISRHLQSIHFKLIKRG